jgi:Domain of unknown function (DUF4430)
VTVSVAVPLELGPAPRPQPAAAAALAAAAAGCGLGPGPASKGEATLTVTRDYGSRGIASGREEDPRASETVLRFLDRNATITTRYGGGFVQSIDGLSGTTSGSRRLDWFFYLNGIESPIGATQARVDGGDRIWWDYRDWTDAMRVPAVVGSWPQPFTAASSDRGGPVAVDCAGARAPCATARRRLEGAGVAARVAVGVRPSPEPRLLVGPWRRLRGAPAAAQLAAAPATSGVFARFERAGGRFSLDLLDVRGRPAARRGPRTGLVAAVRDGDRPPTWVVTGVGPAGVKRAVGLLDGDDLRDRYAVAATPAAAVPLPLIADAAGSTR